MRSTLYFEFLVGKKRRGREAARVDSGLGKCGEPCVDRAIGPFRCKDSIGLPPRALSSSLSLFSFPADLWVKGSEVLKWLDLGGVEWE